MVHRGCIVPLWIDINSIKGKKMMFWIAARTVLLEHMFSVQKHVWNSCQHEVESARQWVQGLSCSTVKTLIMPVNFREGNKSWLLGHINSLDN